VKIAVLVDYWNFHLTLDRQQAIARKVDNYRSKIDWNVVGPLFANTACPVLSVDPKSLSYEGMYIYTSFNPSTEAGTKFNRWATGWLNRQPGINVQIRERKPKALPTCPTCHKSITHCPHTGCEKPIVATVEKGIDTLLVTDLIRLAVGGQYDAAVVVSSDADMVPAVEFVQSQGKKIIQAGFPPIGIDLATKCWGSFDIRPLAGQIDQNK
jgi:uncharacterized LabA/DUF88 family protein